MAWLVNERTGTVVVDVLEIADTRRARRRGLLGRRGLDAGHGLLIRPCLAIHTAWMRFAIDVVFIDASGTVIRYVSGVAPWRVAASPRARAVVELPAGWLARRPVAVGDRLRVCEEAVA